MNRNKIITAILILVIVLLGVLVVFSSTLVPSRDESTIQWVDVGIPLKYNEVLDVNYTQFDTKMAALNKTFIISYPNGTVEEQTVSYEVLNDSKDDCISYCVSMNYSNFNCMIYANKTTEKAWLSAEISGGSTIELESIKTELKDAVSEVTNAAGIRIDWSEASWTVTYED